MNPFDGYQFKEEVELSDLAIANLNGRVKEVETKVFQRDYEPIEATQLEAPKEICLDRYDEAGKLLETSGTTLDRQSCWKAVYTYDQEGRLREECEYDDQDLTRRVFYRFDKEGRKMLEESLLYKRLTQSIYHHYKVYYVYEDSSVEAKNRVLECFESLRFINEAGQIVWQKSHKEGMGNFEGQEVLVEEWYSYYGEGLIKAIITKSLYIDSGNRYTEKQIYHFAKDSRQVETSFVTLPNPAVKATRKITYDESGNEIGNEFKGDYDNYKITRAFDERNNMISMQSDYCSRIFVYEYDQAGNWTKKSLVSEDARVVLEERVIRYYL